LNDKEIEELFQELATRIQEEIMDADDSLLECKECNNNENFIISYGMDYMTVKKGTNKIINIHGERRIHKADDIIFICQKCKKIVLEGCW
jgi:hypoxanthine-guanine phosphoribosyltransferase